MSVIFAWMGITVVLIFSELLVFGQEIARRSFSDHGELLTKMRGDNQHFRDWSALPLSGARESKMKNLSLPSVGVSSREYTSFSQISSYKILVGNDVDAPAVNSRCSTST
jgi:hypothetical protein